MIFYLNYMTTCLLSAYLLSVGRAAPIGYGCASMNLTVGAVRGNVWGPAPGDVEEFLTIPYAVAPHRFDRSTPLPHGLPGPSPFDATDIRGHGEAACLQPGPPYTAGSGKAYGVEACLLLNIYKPRDEAHTVPPPRAVLLWIFGGDNSASEILPYNASRLAALHDAVVVTVSYRLGAFGFGAFASDVASGAGSGAGAGTGNNGMHDVLGAAAWVQREHVALGIDPARIVAFGESSGATDAQLLTLAPAAAGLIAGSISESGGLYAKELGDAINATRRVGERLGCSPPVAQGPSGGGDDSDDVDPLKECLRRASAAELVNASEREGWGPTVDGSFLAAQPGVLLAAGGLNPGVSVLWGANTNDSASPFALNEYVSKAAYVRQLNATVHGAHHPSYSHSGGGSVSTARLPAWRGRRHKSSVMRASRALAAAMATSSQEATASDDDLLKRALALYPPRTPGIFKPDPLGNNAPLIGWFESDQFLCGARREVLAASAAVSGGGAAFAYRFDWFFQSSKSCIADSNYHDPKSGSNHCDEMSFVHGQPIFDNQDAPGLGYHNCSDPASLYYDEKRCVGCAFDAREARLSAAVGAFWARLAARGAPSADSDVWPAFTAAERRGIVLHPDASHVEADMGRPEACALWDDVARRRQEAR